VYDNVREILMYACMLVLIAASYQSFLASLTSRDSKIRVFASSIAFGTMASKEMLLFFKQAPSKHLRFATQ
jgi:predicted membrane channel-forming protein YqfA (hemolysin III family)